MTLPLLLQPAFPRMRRRGVLAAAVAFVLLHGAAIPLAGAEDPSDAESAHRVLPEKLPGGITPSKMVRDSLHNEANRHFEQWRKRYEERTEPDEVAEYQKHLKKEFIERVGGLPENVPLNPKITGTVKRDGYTLEKVLLESEPNFYVTAGLFLPDPEKFPPPWPGVIVVCGHSNEGKLQLGYQSGTALAALNGMAAMIVDPIGQGERKQVLDDAGKPAVPGATTEHTLLGTGAILVGWNTARWMISDAKAAIDYLQSRDDIQGDKIGCMGNSGGGTQTSYMMALDDRVTAAAPSCYITSFKRLLETIGPQDAEQNIYGQIALGMDHADYVMMRAPKPTLLCCATEDFFDIGGTWGSYRDAKRLFTRYNAGRNVELVEVDAKHGWHVLLRQASVSFMAKHLSDRVIEVTEPEIDTLSAKEMNVTPTGQVLHLDGAVSAFDHVRREADRLAELRKERGDNPAQRREAIRKTAKISPADELAEPKIEKKDEVKIGNLKYQQLIFRIGDDIWLPALLARPEGESKAEKVTCLFPAAGKQSVVGADGEVERRVADGETVLAVDLRGVGEMLPEGQRWYHQRFGVNGGNAILAYLLEKSLVGIRAEDCMVIAKAVQKMEGTDKIDVVASGELTVPLLHAAALEPGLFGSVEIRQGLRSWDDVISTPLSENQVPMIVHGALRYYDLPDLEELIGDSLTVASRHDARDQLIE